MIEVENLVKRYGNMTAVKGINFRVEPGEIVGLLGPNGAGKTTTMRMLTGFMPPTEGTIQICGFDVVEDSMSVRQRVGYMPERVPVYPDMTVEGYVTFWAKLRGVRDVRARVHAVLEQFQLLDRRKQLVRFLSKGLRQRLGLAQALVHQPPVIILDEPTIGIDPRQVIEVRDAVRSLREGHAVLFSSHILSEVEQVCDRVIIINHGQIVGEGTPETLSRQLAGRQQIFVVVEGGSDARISAFLRKIPDVVHVRAMDDGFLITTKSDVDLRPTLSRLITQEGFTIVEMRAVDASLEDVFLTLTETKQP
ncbi:ABC transporter ATP-binding protein [Aggregatilineales bacterium SYSU G02658]